MAATASESQSTRRSGEPVLASVASWAVLVASFGLSASTWIALARVAGFTNTLSVPGSGITLALAWLMPIAVDGYVVVALVLWMAPVPVKVAAFAKKNTYGAAGIGIVAQSAYHLLFTLSTTDETWRVALAAVVGALPPAVAGLAVHMRALIRREISTSTVPATTSVSTPPAPTHPTTDLSTIDNHAVPTTIVGPATPSAPSAMDSDLTRPAVTPERVRPEVPTPAVVAARITAPRPATIPTVPATAPVSADRVTSARPSRPSTPAPRLAASSTDIHVAAPDAAQLTLPIVPPDLLTRAAQVARQYRTEHGTPITPGQLAARLRVNSDQATQALAVLNLATDSPTTPITTVNGHRQQATR